MLKASGAMAAATLLSRVLGMVRVMVYARFMGDGWVAGAFTFAFRFRIFSGGCSAKAR
jgi:putative peptidoglycan lipid II flippase